MTLSPPFAPGPSSADLMSLAPRRRGIVLALPHPNESGRWNIKLRLGARGTVMPPECCAEEVRRRLVAVRGNPG